MPSAFVCLCGQECQRLWFGGLVSLALCPGSVVEERDSDCRLVRLEAHETGQAAVLIGGPVTEWNAG